MLELKTEFGTFGNFQDVIHYMEQENIGKITIEAYYVFTKILKLTFLLQELKEKVEVGELV